MSQFRPEVVPFPFIPLILAIVTLGLFYLIGKWVYDYVAWMWNNRAPPRHHKSKSKSHKRSRRKIESSDSEEGSSSE